MLLPILDFQIYCQILSTSLVADGSSFEISHNGYYSNYYMDVYTIGLSDSAYGVFWNSYSSTSIDLFLSLSQSF